MGERKFSSRGPASSELRPQCRNAGLFAQMEIPDFRVCFAPLFIDATSLSHIDEEGSMNRQG
jgi:hypothetical protein